MTPVEKELTKLVRLLVAALAEHVDSCDCSLCETAGKEMEKIFPTKANWQRRVTEARR